jgi:hypothetical protein
MPLKKKFEIAFYVGVVLFAFWLCILSSYNLGRNSVYIEWKAHSLKVLKLQETR